MTLKFGGQSRVYWAGIPGESHGSQPTAEGSLYPQPRSPHSQQWQHRSMTLVMAILASGGRPATRPGHRKGPLLGAGSRDLALATVGLHEGFKLGCPIFCEKKPLLIFLTSNTEGVEAGECTGKAPE